MKRAANSRFVSVAASATGPHQWLTLYSNGTARVHTADLAHRNKAHKHRTLRWRPSKAEYRALERLIWKFNLVAAGQRGTECRRCAV